MVKYGSMGLASMRRLVPSLLLLLAALSGCTDAPADDEAAADHAGHAGAMHQMQDVTFFQDTVDITDTLAGTFQPTDHNAVQTVVGALGLPTTNVQTHDVSGLIPDGIPAFVSLSIDAAPTMYAWLAASDFSAIWTSDCGPCEGGGIGTSWSGAVLDGGETFTVNVWDSNTGAPAADGSYSVDIAVTAAPDRLPSGVVVEVEMPDLGSHILFESVEGAVPDVLVFDPQDNYLTTLPGGNSAQMYIEEGMPTGAYAFLPAGHGSFYKLRSGSDVAEGETLQVTARILDQVIQSGGPRPADGTGSYEVQMDVQPLQTGILVFGGVSNGATVRTDAPGGVQISASVQGPTVAGFGAFSQTDMGDDRLQPGTYTVSYDVAENDGSVQVQEFFTLYGR